MSAITCPIEGCTGTIEASTRVYLDVNAARVLDVGRVELNDLSFASLNDWLDGSACNFEGEFTVSCTDGHEFDWRIGDELNARLSPQPIGDAPRETGKRAGGSPDVCGHCKRFVATSTVAATADVDAWRVCDACMEAGAVSEFATWTRDAETDADVLRRATGARRVTSIHETRHADGSLTVDRVNVSGDDESVTRFCGKCGAAIVVHRDADAAYGVAFCDDHAETWEDAEVQRNRERFAVALDEFKAATSELAARWEAIEDPFAVDNYPEGLPSFDEFAHAVADMAPRRLLTHDQLQGLARIADDASKGAYGYVSTVSVALRADGRADVYVNHERQSFVMDEYGNPVQR